MAQAHALPVVVDTHAPPAIRNITTTDLLDALSKGLQDFSAMPSHAVFLCIVYPIIGVLLFGMTFGLDILPLLYPLATGFALAGPFAAVGLYEMSRRREAGLPVSFGHLYLSHTRARWSIAALGLVLLVIFLTWLGTARQIYIANFGYAAPESIAQFTRDVLFTPAGWNLIIIGNAVGFVFAVVVLAISVVSFPMLIDRDVGVGTAVLTSVRAVAANPVNMALWGLIVAALLFVGSLPLFLGLVIVLPVLGHATWHLYRKVVEPGPLDTHAHDHHDKPKNYAADFPVALFYSWREKE
jgi:uncharacterized membrane protein